MKKIKVLVSLAAIVLFANFVVLDSNPRLKPIFQTDDTIKVLPATDAGIKFGSGTDIEKALTISEITQQSVDFKTAQHIREQALESAYNITIAETDLADDSTTIQFVIKDAENIIGSMGLKPAKSDGVWHINHIAVDPAYQGQNINGFLIRYCEGYARTKNGLKISHIARMSAIGFYEKIGFSTIGEEFYKYGASHVQIEKLLN